MNHRDFLKYLRVAAKPGSLARALGNRICQLIASMFDDTASGALLLSEEFWTGRDSLGSIENSALQNLSRWFTGKISEAEYHARNRVLVAALAFLDRAEAKTRGRKRQAEILHWKTLLLYRSRRWTDLVKTIENRLSDKEIIEDEELAFYYAKSLWETGNLKKARRYFNKLKLDKRPGRKKILQRFRRAWHVSNAAIPAGLLADSLDGNNPELLEAIEQWYSVNEFKIDQSQLAGLIANAAMAVRNCRRFHGVELRDSDFPTSEQVDAGRLLFVSGFGWSGSGAVTAFLSDHHDIQAVSRKEIIWTQGRSTVPMTSLAHIWKDGHFDSGEFADFIETGLLGLLRDTRLAPRIQRVFTDSLIGECLQRGVEPDWLVDLIDSMCSRIANAQAISEVLASLSALATNAITSTLQPGRYGLLDNALMAPKVHVLSLFPGAKAIVVKRDTRDQYTARLLESRRDETPEKFEKLIRTTVHHFNERARQITDKERVLPITFEAFLQDASLRLRIQQWLDLDQGRMKKARTASFDVSKSIRNVGIANNFRDEAWHERLSKLEQELPYSKIFQFTHNTE